MLLRGAVFGCSLAMAQVGRPTGTPIKRARSIEAAASIDEAACDGASMRESEIAQRAIVQTFQLATDRGIAAVLAPCFDGVTQYVTQDWQDDEHDVPFDAEVVGLTTSNSFRVSSFALCCASLKDARTSAVS